MDVNQAIEHGRRWIAAGWKWAPGQVVIWFDTDGELCRRIVYGVGSNGLQLPTFGVGFPQNAVPDMRDDGTRGHALGQVREAWGSPGMYAAHDEPSLLRRGDPDPGEKLWRVRGLGSGKLVDQRFASESEALLAARKAAA